MERNKYIAYIRVSTNKQGHSGLGLEAQKEIIIHNAGSENIEEWYVEIHSGKNLHRLPQLIAAKQKAKEKGYVLIIAKTDRLRNTQQALDLVDELTPQGVWFCNVGRNADKFMLTLFFAFAEKERLEISIRTKAALAVLKANGAKLGRPAKKKRKTMPKEKQLELARKGADARLALAINNTKNVVATNIALVLRQQRFSYKKIADHLNQRGYETPNHSRWRGSGVYKLISRYLRYVNNSELTNK